MENPINSDADNADPLALQPETEDSGEYDVNISIEPEIIIEDTRQLRRSKRCGNKQLKNEVPQKQVKLQLTEDDSSPAPLFPITLKMVERIRRMKQRMLITLKLSDKLLPEGSEKRARQTRESRQRATCAGVDCRRKKTEKKTANTKKQRQMQTAEQLATRRAKTREETRRAENEYRRLYGKNRKPISFAQ